jgi:nicotinamide-nucleotide amidase
MEAEIITIGTEILLGEIVDTNTRTLARRLRDIGIDIYLTTTVGDNSGRIAAAVQSSAARTDVIITTGGLGPTIDDATREGIALATETNLTFSDDLWQQIQERFAEFGRKPTENNRRQAYIPEGALPIENPVGTAPSFILETKTVTIIALPGVPSEMSHLLENNVIPYLKKRLGSHDIILSRLVRTAGIGESVLDERISDLEELSNPTVGLSAHPGRVDIRITAKAKTTHQAEEMLWAVQATLEQRLKKHIYGFDDQTLESVVIEMLKEERWKLAAVELGTDGLLANNLALAGDVIIAAEQLALQDLKGSLESHLEARMKEHDASVGLAVKLDPNEGQGSSLEIVALLPGYRNRIDEQYPKVFVNMKARAVSFALDLLRRSMLHAES